jgi:hypothetical protein
MFGLTQFQIKFNNDTEQKLAKNRGLGGLLLCRSCALLGFLLLAQDQTEKAGIATLTV